MSNTKKPIIKRNPLGKNMGHDARIVVESVYWHSRVNKGERSIKHINLLADVRLSFNSWDDENPANVDQFRLDAFAAQAALIKAYEHYPDGELQSRIEFDTDFIEGGYNR